MHVTTQMFSLLVPAVLALPLHTFMLLTKRELEAERGGGGVLVALF